MKCVIGGHTDALDIDTVDRYCWNHYQIFWNLWFSHKDVDAKYGPLSWEEFLTKILDVNYKDPWKDSILAADSAIQDSILGVASYELSLSDNINGKFLNTLEDT